MKLRRALQILMVTGLSQFARVVCAQHSPTTEESAAPATQPLSRPPDQGSVLREVEIIPSRASKPYRGKFKEALKVPVVLLGFENSIDLTRANDELNAFNRIFQQCNIELKSPVILRMLSNPVSRTHSLSLMQGKDEDANNAALGQLMKNYGRDGLPIMYINDVVPNAGQVGLTLTDDKDRGFKDLKKFFPVGGSIVMADIRRPHIIAEVPYAKGVETLSHEMGHFLFDCAHEGGITDLMWSLSPLGGGKEKKRDRGTHITKEQCLKARAKIAKLYPQN